MVITEPWWMWGIFFIIVISALIVDFSILKKRRAHKVSVRESFTWTMVWVILAMLFALLIWIYHTYVAPTPQASTKTLEFLTAYILEKSLSIDNLFVFLMVFQFFSIPDQYQGRVLLYGIIGAIVMRFIIILSGIYLVNQFEWLLYLFGVFLLITGIKMLVLAKHEGDLSNNPLLKFISKHVRVTEELESEKFFVKKNKLLYATPLFVALLFIETSDLIFAMDSIPAAFSVTRDSFIVFTSNIFAVLGLRALYFLFSHLANRFSLLKYGISVLLIFAGVKMLIEDWYKIPVGISLTVIAGVLIIAIVASLYHSKNKKLIGSS